MPHRPFMYSFNGGEVSKRFAGRADHQRYYASLEICENFVTSPVGNADRRPGTRFLAPAKDQGRACRLMPFEFSVEQAYVVEAGHQYMRFFRNRRRVESPPGSAVETATPYQESDLFDLQTVQQNDVMWIVHGLRVPHKLLRFGETTWAVQPIPFDPPPSVEVPTVGQATLTLGALSGSGVVVLSDALTFLDGDVGRELALLPSQGSLARATITALNFPAPTNNITINITSPFPFATLTPGTWHIDGPLGTALQIETVGPEPLKGTFAKGRLRQRTLVNAELVTAQPMTGWTDHSGIVLASGTHTGGGGPNLQDTTKHFPALGVRVGMRVTNTSTSQQGTVTVISPDGKSLSVGITFNSGQGYTVIGTGGVQIANSGAQLSGGNAGTGWIERPIVTVAGRTYRIVFEVYEGPISVQVGSFSTGANLFSEASFAIGNDQEVVFTALTGTSYIQFRNNQPTMSRVAGISARSISARGWRPTDQGGYVKAYNGVFEVAGFDDDYTAILVIKTPPQGSMDTEAIAGAWTLEAPAWSAARGYPRSISFNQQRLALLSTLLQPLTAWQSETGNYEQFGASALADSSLEHEFTANVENRLLWAEPFKNLLVGTAVSEHLLHGVNGPLTPSNGEQLPLTAVGSNGLRPLRIHNALLIMRRGGRQITELIFDENGEVVEGKDHTIAADHITTSGVVQWVVQKQPTVIAWAVRTDGVLIGLTYQQIEQVQGWHRHLTSGSFESVCVIPISAPVDDHTEDVYVSVKRVIDGQVRRYIEVMDHTLTLDCAITYSGPATTTITGLDHLEGQVVSVIDKSHGVNQPAMLHDQVVSLGEITVEVPVTLCDIGLDYAPILRPLRPEIPQREGTLQGKRKKWTKLTARVLQTSALTINGHEAVFRSPDDDMDEGLVLRDGDMEVTSLGYTRDGYVTIEQADPLPCTIVALYGEMEVEDG